MTGSKISILIRSRGNTRGGPSVFRNRLYQAIKKLNVKVCDNLSKRHDVEISFISLPKSKKPVVVRIDGCYYMKQHLSNNKPIARAIAKADFVIFQSQFSEKMCCAITGKTPRQRDVIYNGIDLSYVDSIAPSEHIEPGSLVCCANWRHNKRLKSIINGFLEASIDRHLYVIGDSTNYFLCKHPKIHWLGDLDSDDIISVMKSCAHLIHLCHIDSCPNVVVEGLSCGLSVLCTNLGGTKEIVATGGVVLDVDKWDFKSDVPSNLDNLPPAVVAEGLHRLVQGNFKIDRERFNIDLVAKKYVDICVSIFNKDNA